jgi:dienelactone hydrolase
MLAYQHHFSDLASFGYVVIAPRSCFMGCPGPTAVLEQPKVTGCLPWVDGDGWIYFVHENTRALDYARTQSDAGVEWASKIDWSKGVGALGHSMGGESLTQLAGAELSAKYNITAAVCEHCLACKETGDLIQTPAMFMTGTGDYEVTPAQVKDAYTKDSVTPKSYRNEKGRGHEEMLDLLVQYNPGVARHAASFFEVWLKGDRQNHYDIVYGDGPTSFCGYADMKHCEHTMGDMPVPGPAPSPTPAPPSPPSPSPVPPSQTHYGQPPCLDDEVMLMVGVSGIICSPFCHGVDRSCPADKPAGASGIFDTPQCGNINQDGTWTQCVIHCHEDSDCDQENGASCHMHPYGVLSPKNGICGYPYSGVASNATVLV